MKFLQLSTISIVCFLLISDTVHGLRIQGSKKRKRVSFVAHKKPKTLHYVATQDELNKKGQQLSKLVDVLYQLSCQQKIHKAQANIADSYKKILTMARSALSDVSVLNIEQLKSVLNQCEKLRIDAESSYKKLSAALLKSSYVHDASDVNMQQMQQMLVNMDVEIKPLNKLFKKWVLESDGNDASTQSGVATSTQDSQAGGVSDDELQTPVSEVHAAQNKVQTDMWSFEESSTPLPFPLVQGSSQTKLKFPSTKARVDQENKNAQARQNVMNEEQAARGKIVKAQSDGLSQLQSQQSKEQAQVVLGQGAKDLGGDVAGDEVDEFNAMLQEHSKKMQDLQEQQQQKLKLTEGKTPAEPLQKIESKSEPPISKKVLSKKSDATGSQSLVQHNPIQATDRQSSETSTLQNPPTSLAPKGTQSQDNPSLAKKAPKKREPLSDLGVIGGGEKIVRAGKVSGAKEQSETVAARAQQYNFTGASVVVQSPTQDQKEDHSVVEHVDGTLSPTQPKKPNDIARGSKSTSSSDIVALGPIRVPVAPIKPASSDAHVEPEKRDSVKDEKPSDTVIAAPQSSADQPAVVVHLPRIPKARQPGEKLALPPLAAVSGNDAATEAFKAKMLQDDVEKKRAAQEQKQQEQQRQQKNVVDDEILARQQIKGEAQTELSDIAVMHKQKFSALQEKEQRNKNAQARQKVMDEEQSARGKIVTAQNDAFGQQQKNILQEHESLARSQVVGAEKTELSRMAAQHQAGKQAVQEQEQQQKQQLLHEQQMADFEKKQKAFTEERGHLLDDYGTAFNDLFTSSLQQGEQAARDKIGSEQAGAFVQVRDQQQQDFIQSQETEARRLVSAAGNTELADIVAKHTQGGIAIQQKEQQQQRQKLQDQAGQEKQKMIQQHAEGLKTLQDQQQQQHLMGAEQAKRAELLKQQAEEGKKMLVQHQQTLARQNVMDEEQAARGKIVTAHSDAFGQQQQNLLQEHESIARSQVVGAEKTELSGMAAQHKAGKQEVQEQQQKQQQAYLLQQQDEWAKGQAKAVDESEQGFSNLFGDTITQLHSQQQVKLLQENETVGKNLQDQHTLISDALGERDKIGSERAQDLVNVRDQQQQDLLQRQETGARQLVSTAENTELNDIVAKHTQGVIAIQQKEQLQQLQNQAVQEKQNLVQQQASELNGIVTQHVSTLNDLQQQHLMSTEQAMRAELLKQQAEEGKKMLVQHQQTLARQKVMDEEQAARGKLLQTHAEESNTLLAQHQASITTQQVVDVLGKRLIVLKAEVQNLYDDLFKGVLVSDLTVTDFGSSSEPLKKYLAPLNRIINNTKEQYNKVEEEVKNLDDALDSEEIDDDNQKSYTHIRDMFELIQAIRGFVSANVEIVTSFLSPMKLTMKFVLGSGADGYKNYQRLSTETNIHNYDAYVQEINFTMDGIERAWKNPEETVMESDDEDFDDHVEQSPQGTVSGVAVVTQQDENEVKKEDQERYDVSRIIALDYYINMNVPPYNLQVPALLRQLLTEQEAAVVYGPASGNKQQNISQKKTPSDAASASKAATLAIAEAKRLLALQQSVLNKASKVNQLIGFSEALDHINGALEDLQSPDAQTDLVEILQLDSAQLKNLDKRNPITHDVKWAFYAHQLLELRVPAFNEQLSTEEPDETRKEQLLLQDSQHVISLVDDIKLEFPYVHMTTFKPLQSSLTEQDAIQVYELSSVINQPSTLKKISQDASIEEYIQFAIENARVGLERLLAILAEAMVANLPKNSEAPELLRVQTYMRGALEQLNSSDLGVKTKLQSALLSLIQNDFALDDFKSWQQNNETVIRGVKWISYVYQYLVHTGVLPQQILPKSIAKVSTKLDDQSIVSSPFESTPQAQNQLDNVLLMDSYMYANAIPYDLKSFQRSPFLEQQLSEIKARQFPKIDDKVDLVLKITQNWLGRLAAILNAAIRTTLYAKSPSFVDDAIKHIEEAKNYVGIFSTDLTSVRENLMLMISEPKQFLAKYGKKDSEYGMKCAYYIYQYLVANNILPPFELPSSELQMFKQLLAMEKKLDDDVIPYKLTEFPSAPWLIGKIKLALPKSLKVSQFTKQQPQDALLKFTIQNQVEIVIPITKEWLQKQKELFDQAKYAKSYAQFDIKITDINDAQSNVESALTELVASKAATDFVEMASKLQLDLSNHLAIVKPTQNSFGMKCAYFVYQLLQEEIKKI